MATTRTDVVKAFRLLLLAALAALAFAKDQPRFTADQVLQRYVQALGGEEAIRKHHSLAVIKDLTIRVREQDINRPYSHASVAVFRKAPDKYLLVSRQERHEYRLGYDGVDGWEQLDGSDPRSLSEDRLRLLKETADFYLVLNLSKWYEKITYDHFDDSKAETAHVLKFLSRRGATCYHYFDASSFLEIRSECQTPPGVAGRLLSSASDYRKVEGVLMPFREEGDSSAHTVGAWETEEGLFSAQVKDIQVNGEIDDAVFSRPHRVKKK